VHQCETLHFAIGGGQSIYNRSKERTHANPSKVHSFSAGSATAWIEADTPRIAQVNFMLAATGDYVSVEIPLERPVGARTERAARPAGTAPGP
jgi:hypothetical protein